jgi:hypothetical protein
MQKTSFDALEMSVARVLSMRFIHFLIRQYTTDNRGPVHDCIEANKIKIQESLPKSL